MVYPAGEKHPGACRACAVKAAGLRGKGGGQRVSKRAIKRRRDELAAMAAELGDPDGFRFFDDPASGFDLRGPLEEAAEDAEPKRRLGRFRRRKGDAAAPASAPAVAGPTPQDRAAEVGGADDGVEFADFLHSPEAPVDPEPETEPQERPPSATELLERLREAQVNGPDLTSYGAPPLDQAPEPGPTDVAAAPPDRGAFAVGPVRSEAAPGSPARRRDADPPVHHGGQPASLGGHGAAPDPSHSAFEAGPFDRPAFDPGPFDSPAFDGPAFDSPAFDSPVGAVAGPDRSAAPGEPDPWVPAMAHTETAMHAETMAAAPDLAVNPFAGSESTRESADKDDSGNWIPPALRGMTPAHAREELPRRRDGE